MLKLRRNNKIFRKLLWSYLIIVIVPICLIGIITYGVFFNQLATDTKKLYINTLEQCKNVFDINIRNINSQVYQLNNNEKVIDFMYSTYADDAKKAYDAWMITSELTQTNTYNSIVESGGLYFAKNDVIINNSSMYSIEAYYHQYLEKSDLTYERFNEIMQISLKKPYFCTLNIQNDGKMNNIIMYSQPVLRKDSNGSGAFIALLNQTELLSILESIKITGKWYFLAVDNHGDISINIDNFTGYIDKALLQSGNEFLYKYQNKKMVGIYGKSDISNLTYIFLMPNGSLTGNVYPVLKMFLLVLVLSFGICTMLAYINANRAYQPIYTMSHENKMLTKDLNIQLKIARNNILINVLRNVHNKDKEISNLENNYNVTFSSKYLGVAIVNIINVEGFGNINYDMELVSVAITNIIDELLENNGIEFYFVRTNNENYVYILNHDINKKVEEIFRQAVIELYSGVMIQVHVGIGRDAYGLENINKSYEDALIALNYAKEEQQVICYNSIQQLETSNIYFSKEKQKVLVNCVKSGGYDDAMTLLGEVYQVNFEQRTLSYDMLSMLINRMGLLLMDIVDDIYSNDKEVHDYYIQLYNDVMKNENLNDSYVILKDAYLQIALYTQEKKYTAQSVRKEEILTYIHQHYNDPNLSLYSIAEAFQMRYNTVSMFFKEQSGYNFVDYLNMYRLEKAKEFLKNSTKSIKDIAELVGYQSSNTFIKIFKKYCDITPGEYRRAEKKLNL